MNLLLGGVISQRQEQHTVCKNVETEHRNKWKAGGAKIDLQSTICAIQLPGHKIYDTGYTIQESEAQVRPPRYTNMYISLLPISYTKHSSGLILHTRRLQSV
jgi:hypothetical protein